MTDKTYNPEEIQGALSKLQDLVKGHNSRGTNTTKVESMRDASVGTGSSAGATQIHHTPNNSDPGTWAGSSSEYAPEDGATDAIEENGTDYNGRLKAAFAKMKKGTPLSAEEFDLVVKATKKAGGFPFGGDESEDEDEGNGPDKLSKEKGSEPAFKAKKSKDKDEDEDPVEKGLEVSEFLSQWNDRIVKSLEGLEARICSYVDQRISSMQSEMDEMNKGIANGIISIGHVAALTGQRVDQMEATAARAPRAVTGVDVIEKSVPSQDGGRLSKQETIGRLEDMLVKGLVQGHDIIKYETTGQISPDLLARVQNYSV